MCYSLALERPPKSPVWNALSPVQQGSEVGLWGVDWLKRALTS